MPLSEGQLERFSRHILLKDVGVEGQERILQGKVLVVGAGGLGAPAALYLAAAGVGTIGMVDGDIVDRTNLQRQVIHFTPDIGKAKVVSAREKMLQVNPATPARPSAEDIRLAYDPNTIYVIASLQQGGAGYPGLSHPARSRHKRNAHYRGEWP
jgi:molybdopterin/thiamine biosynthesis adenylyltransferase